jgi:hypothetical protein
VNVRVKKNKYINRIGKEQDKRKMSSDYLWSFVPSLPSLPSLPSFLGGASVSAITTTSVKQTTKKEEKDPFDNYNMAISAFKDLELIEKQVDEETKKEENEKQLDREFDTLASESTSEYSTSVYKTYKTYKTSSSDSSLDSLMDHISDQNEQVLISKTLDEIVSDMNKEESESVSLSETETIVKECESATPSASASATVTPSASASATPSASASATVTPSASATVTPSASATVTTPMDTDFEPLKLLSRYQSSENVVLDLERKIFTSIGKENDDEKKEMKEKDDGEIFLLSLLLPSLDSTEFIQFYSMLLRKDHRFASFFRRDMYMYRRVEKDCFADLFHLANQYAAIGSEYMRNAENMARFRQDLIRTFDEYHDWFNTEFHSHSPSSPFVRQVMSDGNSNSNDDSEFDNWIPHTCSTNVKKRKKCCHFFD